MRTAIFTVILSLALASVEASAQDVAPEPQEVSEEQAVPPPPEAGDDRVDALEARIESLEARLAQAEREEASAGTEAQAEVEAPAEEEAPAPFTIGGWAEAYWAWSFNEPSNGIIDLRGFDNRHNSFNLSNVVLDAQWDYEGVNGRISLQWGSTPATYYLAETAAPSLGSGVGAQSQSLWQFVQQAYVGYRIPVGAGLNVQAGLWLSPIGPENMNVKNNWFWSRSNLFFGLPFYHTGIRVSYPVLPELTVEAWAMNGWNTVLDNNDEKSVLLSATLTLPKVSATFNYLFGVERPEGAPEGRAWRNVLDVYATLSLTDWLGVQPHVSGGFEPNEFGTSHWLAGALAVRVAPVEWLAFSARGDMFWESVASNATGSASAIFWPVEWVSSTTLSVELKPVDHVSFRLEYRHDQAADGACDGSPTQACAYFRGAVIGDGVMTPFLRNTSTQDTITLGTTAWF